MHRIRSGTTKSEEKPGRNQSDIEAQKSTQSPKRQMHQQTKRRNGRENEGHLLLPRHLLPEPSGLLSYRLHFRTARSIGGRHPRTRRARVWPELRRKTKSRGRKRAREKGSRDPKSYISTRRRISMLFGGGAGEPSKSIPASYNFREFFRSELYILYKRFRLVLSNLVFFVLQGRTWRGQKTQDPNLAN